MNAPPIWLVVPWSAAMVIAVFWQPRWMKRLSERSFLWLAESVERGWDRSKHLLSEWLWYLLFLVGFVTTGAGYLLVIAYA